jgi:Rieske 2Fe-2S family protein
MASSSTPIRRDPGYLGLTSVIESLPAAHYFDPEQYQRELSRIWYRNWVYVCRSSDIARPRAYRTFGLGDQSLLVVRGEDRVARAFHNTCRHRGSVLCRDAAGTLPAAGIVCPYHAWRYSLRGELLQTSSRAPGEGFELRDFPLFGVPLTEWNGFIFISLTDQPPPFEASFDLPSTRLDDWPLAELAVGHRLTKTIHCNWKVFWENYNECLHCPGVHPRLSQLVPIFGRGLLERRDDPKWQDNADDDDPKFEGGVRRGAASWTMDGQPVGVPFPKVSEADRRLGHIYLTSLPSVFLAAHVDYVRVVALRPRGPELTEMSIEFLFLPETLADPKRDIMKAVQFTDIVMSEDAAICEVNQRGLHALPLRSGVLMPEEYALRQFHDWVRAEMTRS